MSKVAIMTDSNSGITQSEARELGVYVLPMPFYINGQLFYEDIDLTQDQFYEMLTQGGEITTSMPLVGNVLDKWDELLKTYDEIVYIPMSSGLSSSCSTATMLADDYDGKVFVVDNQRISVTMRQSVMEAKHMADDGADATAIYDFLMQTKMESSIYIMVDTLTYLKKGGRLTPAVAAIGNLLRLKPVLQIQGEKLDTYATSRTVKQAKQIMMDAIEKDISNRFGGDPSCVQIDMAHTDNQEAIEEFRQEVLSRFPNREIVINPLSLSVSCHIGPGALAVTVSKKHF